jgi:hypothetical protein
MGSVQGREPKGLMIDELAVMRYGAQLRLFKAWCKRRGYADAPPVAPAIVASWLLERADE